MIVDIASRRLVRPVIVARCSCGRQYTEDQWRLLRYVGRCPDGAGGELELRNCICCSTQAIEVPLARPAPPRKSWWRRLLGAWS